MKRSDLFRRYAEVIDLCKGTNVEPEQCVKLNGKAEFYDSPAFNADPDKYTFALAIVEDKPVFAGDVLYNEHGEKYIVQEVEKHINGKLAFRTVSQPNPDGHWVESYSWTKPDPFAELLQAQAEGKRIVFYDGAKWVDATGIDTVNFKPESYKVVENDISETVTIWVSAAKNHVKTKYIKDGITGKITAEVIE